MKKMLLMLLICSAFMLSLSAVSAAEYTEVYDLNNGWIDGTRDAKYELLHNSTSEQIWFAHSSTRFAFYIESNITLSTIAINSTNLSGDFSDANVIAKFVGNRSEIVILKSYLGEKVAFAITINSGILILLDPLGAFIPPEPTPTETTTTPTETNTTTNATTNGGLDLVAFFKNVGDSGVFWFFIALLFIFAADYNNHPVVFVASPNGELKELGRFIAETDCPELKKKKFIFLNTKGLQEVFSDYSFRSLDIFRRQRIYVIRWDYPHLILTTHKVPEDVKMKKKEFLRTWKNYIIYGLFVFFRFTPFRFASVNLYNLLKTKDINLTEVDFLIPFISMDCIEYRYKIKYKQEVLNPEIMKTEYKEVEKENLLYSDIKALDGLKITELQYLEVKAITIHFSTLKEALEDRYSRGEIINNYENRMTGLEIKNFALEQRLQNALATIQKQRLETDEKIRESLRPYEEYSEYLRQSLPEMLSSILKLRGRGIPEQKAMEMVVLEQIEKSDKEKIELKTELTRLQSKLEKSSNKPKSITYNPNILEISEKAKGEPNDE